MDYDNYFKTSYQHILAELTRIDLLVRTQVLRARQIVTYDDRFLGLRISEDEVDALLRMELPALPRWATEPTTVQSEQFHEALTHVRAEIDALKATSNAQGVSLRLDQLTAHFGLDRLDVDILMVCLAQEIDLRYVRLYAYLQDNVNKKWPSVDLTLTNGSCE